MNCVGVEVTKKQTPNNIYCCGVHKAKYTLLQLATWVCQWIIIIQACHNAYTLHRPNNFSNWPITRFSELRQCVCLAGWLYYKTLALFTGISSYQSTLTDYHWWVPYVYNIKDFKPIVFQSLETGHSLSCNTYCLTESERLYLLIVNLSLFCQGTTFWSCLCGCKNQFAFATACKTTALRWASFWHF